LKVGVIGGSGGLGGGLALRLARRNEVVVGSRDEDRARSVAKELGHVFQSRFGGIAAGEISGASNPEAVAQSDVVVLAVPADTLEGFLENAKGYAWRGQLVLSPVTRFVREGGTFTYKPFLTGGRTTSAAELIQETLGGGARVVSGLHCVPAARLANLGDPLGFDVPLAGPKDSVATAAQLLEGVEGLRPLFAGPLAVSASLEALTPLLLNISVRNKIKEPGFRVVS
jgi:NADPH-dependent F420 reductase